MRAFIIGDTHGFLELIQRARKIALKQKCDCIIVCGDFGWWPKWINKDKSLHMFLSLVTEQKKIPIYFVDGNHEELPDLFSYPIREDGLRELGPALFHIPRGNIVDIFGAKIFGYGGGHSIDRAFRTEGVDWFPEEVPTYAECDKAITNLEETDELDLIITHDIPTELKFRMFPKQYAYNTVPEQLSQFIEPCMKFPKDINWFTGHYHMFHRQKVANCWIQVLPNHPTDGMIFNTKINKIEEI